MTSADWIANPALWIASMMIAGILGALVGRIRPSQRLAELNEMLQNAQLERERIGAQLDALRTEKDRLQAELVQLTGELAEHQRCRHEAERECERLSTGQQALQARLKEADARIQTLEADNRTLIGERDQLNTRLARLSTEMNERDASHKREVERFKAHLEEQKLMLVEQFKNLSNELLEQKSRALQEHSQTSLKHVLSPFREAMESFRKEVQEIHHRETQAQSELRKELEHLRDLNKQITQEAHELSTALHGQKKIQGNWGELVLERVLEHSGLTEGQDYKREVSFTTDEGRKRPDVVVYLPQNKHLIIDAKVSLSAYTRYVNAEEESERALALKEHVQAVKNRISELAERDYVHLPGIHSPEVVFLFIPIESAFVEALKADESIFQQALEQHVLVATPTTLLTSLNIVRQLWRYEKQNKHMAELARKAGSVYKKLNSFLKSFEKIRSALDTARDAYTQAERQLVNGRGNLVKQVNDFKELVPSIEASLPEYFVEKAALEMNLPGANTENAVADTHGAISNEQDGETSGEDR